MLSSIFNICTSEQARFAHFSRRTNQPYWKPLSTTCLASVTSLLPETRDASLSAPLCGRVIVHTSLEKHDLICRTPPPRRKGTPHPAHRIQALSFPSQDMADLQLADWAQGAVVLQPGVAARRVVEVRARERAHALANLKRVQAYRAAVAPSLHWHRRKGMEVRGLASASQS